MVSSPFIRSNWFPTSDFESADRADHPAQRPVESARPDAGLPDAYSQAGVGVGGRGGAARAG